MSSYTNINLFFNSFSRDNTLLDLSLQAKYLLKNKFFDRLNFVDEVLKASIDQDFDWIEQALKAGFIRNKETPTLSFENLITSIDQIEWSKIHEDAKMYFLNKNDLRNLFRDFYLENSPDEMDIETFLNLPYFCSVGFELKCEFYKVFTQSSFEQDDIIYHLKQLSNNQLGVHFVANGQPFVKRMVLEILSSQENNQGWLDSIKILAKINNAIIDVRFDLFDLEFNIRDSSIELMPPYRNDISLGFQRIKK